MQDANLTQPQRLLVAAAELGDTPFTTSALVVRAWLDAPDIFGLEGYAQTYPDANRVLAAIMGERGLAKRGWLIRTASKTYTLSPQGRAEVQRLLTGGPSPVPLRRTLPHIRIPKPMEARLAPLFATAAFRRHQDGMTDQIGYRDACAFWRLDTGLTGPDVDNVIGATPELIADAGELINGDAVHLSTGQEVSREDLDALAACHAMLVATFARQVGQQRARAFRRVG